MKERHTIIPSGLSIHLKDSSNKNIEVENALPLKYLHWRI